MNFTDETISLINSDIEKYFFFQWTKHERDPPDLPAREDLPKFLWNSDSFFQEEGGGIFDSIGGLLEGENPIGDFFKQV